MLYMNLLLQSSGSYEFMSPFSFGGSLGTWKFSVSLVAHRLSDPRFVAMGFTAFCFTHGPSWRPASSSSESFGGFSFCQLGLRA